MGGSDDCGFVEEGGSAIVGPVSVRIFSKTSHPRPVATVRALRDMSRVDVDTTFTEI
jgi:hypothetical protein